MFKPGQKIWINMSQEQACKEKTSLLPKDSRKSRYAKLINDTNNFYYLIVKSFLPASGNATVQKQPNRSITTDAMSWALILELTLFETLPRRRWQTAGQLFSTNHLIHFDDRQQYGKNNGANDNSHKNNHNRFYK